MHHNFALQILIYQNGSQFNNFLCQLNQNHDIFSYLSVLEVDEIVGLVDEEHLNGTSPQVVSSQMDFSQMWKGPLEVLSKTLWTIKQKA